MSKKSTNTVSSGDRYLIGVGAGVMDLDNSNGGIPSTGAVPGAEIWSLEKSKHWRDFSCDFSVQTSADIQKLDIGCRFEPLWSWYPNLFL